MRQVHHRLEIQSPGPGLHDVTWPIAHWINGTNISNGLATIFCQHTSASLLIQENAAPAARRDLEAYFERIAPESPSLYTHDEEGPDDMPAHLRAALTQVHLSIPVLGGVLELGTWQGVYLFEHRLGQHRRTLICHLLGE